MPVVEKIFVDSNEEESYKRDFCDVLAENWITFLARFFSFIALDMTSPTT